MTSKSDLSAYISQFMTDFKLWPRGQKAVLAVSAGVDSMLMLDILGPLLKSKYQVEVWHFNHGTRGESQIKEQELVLKHASFLDIPAKIFALEMNENKDDGNFEFRARKKREEVYSKELSSKDTLYMAHHLNDSLEWFLMQTFKSSSPKMTWGIPVKNGAKRRPFHCLSKEQIRKFANQFSISFLEDESNQDHRYERNFMREMIQTSIEGNYSKYLAHYASKANQGTKDQGQFCGPESVSAKIIRDAIGQVCLWQSKVPGHFDGQEGRIDQALKMTSSTKRGEVRLQRQKIISAQKVGKRGPLYLSGGVQVFLYPGLLVFQSKAVANKIKMMDKELANKLMNAETTQIPELSISSLVTPKMSLAPFFALSKKVKNFGLRSLKKDPIWPHLSTSLQQKGLWFRPFPHLALQGVNLKKEGNKLLTFCTPEI
jgi:tRNA(Ile)-lysidine synthase